MIVLVMGVCGAGKTCVGSALATHLGWPFLEGDDFHSPANVAKMRGGVPLTDADRWPWIDAMNASLREAQGDSAVLACSALKASYRDRLLRGIAAPLVVFLHGDPALIADRLAGRSGHYMPPSLLPSQLAALEPPQQALALDCARPVAELVEAIAALTHRGSAHGQSA
jgi:carbohydrate kinase (thermoresistant glucokinase family)